MKKLLLGLGSIAAIAAPIAAVVSCGDEKTPPTKPGTNTGQPVTATEITSTYATSKSLSDLTMAVAAYTSDKTQEKADAVFALFTSSEGKPSISSMYVFKMMIVNHKLILTSETSGQMISKVTFTIHDAAVVMDTHLKIANAKANAFMESVLTKVKSDDALGKKVEEEFRTTLVIGAITGTATNDAAAADTSNNFFPHDRTTVRVLNNEENKLSFSFNLSTTKTTEIFSAPVNGSFDVENSPAAVLESKIEAALRTMFGETVPFDKHNELFSVRAGFYSSTTRKNGANPQVTNGADDYFRVTFNFAKNKIAEKTGIRANQDGTVLAFAKLFANPA